MRDASWGAWVLLLLAIVGELVGTSALKMASDGRHLAWAAVAIGYGAALWLLNLVIAKIDLGVAYAVWSGVGIALIALVGVLFFDERLSWMRAVGLLAIVLGTSLLQLDGERGGQAEQADAVSIEARSR